MKKAALFLTLAICLTLGCGGRIYGPVEQVKALAEEKEDVITQIGKKLEANPTEAGVDEARKLFDGKKDSLKAKRDAIKAAPQGLNADWRSLQMKLNERHRDMLTAVKIKLGGVCNVNACEDKWRSLVKNFDEVSK